MTPPTKKEVEVAKSNGISYDTLYQRLLKGWDRKKAITAPLKSGHHREVYWYTTEQFKEAYFALRNKGLNNGQICKEFGITRPTLLKYCKELEETLDVKIPRFYQYTDLVPIELMIEAVKREIPQKTVWYRINEYFWPAEEACTEPIASRSERRTHTFKQDVV